MTPPDKARGPAVSHDAPVERGGQTVAAGLPDEARGHGPLHPDHIETEIAMPPDEARGPEHDDVIMWEARDSDHLLNVGAITRENGRIVLWSGSQRVWTSPPALPAPVAGVNFELHEAAARVRRVDAEPAPLPGADEAWDGFAHDLLPYLPRTDSAAWFAVLTRHRPLIEAAILADYIKRLMAQPPIRTATAPNGSVEVVTEAEYQALHDARERYEHEYDPDARERGLDVDRWVAMAAKSAVLRVERQTGEPDEQYATRVGIAARAEWFALSTPVPKDYPPTKTINSRDYREASDGD